MGKPVFRVCAQLRLKPACSAAEASWSLAISAIANGGTDSKQTKAQIRLRRSATLLFAHDINRWLNYYGLFFLAYPFMDSHIKA